MASLSNNIDNKPKIVLGDAGYVLEDVPHLSDYMADLPTYPNPLQDNPAYSVVKQYFVHVDDTVPQKVVAHRNSPRGIHFRRAGPRQRVYFESDEVHACIVTCGGLCPGLNTVIRELVCGLYHMYGVKKVLGIEGGYRGFYSKNTISLTPKVVNDIHKRGGTILGTSRGGHDTSKIVDSIQDRGINQVYIIGGDGTQKGAAAIFEEVRKRGLKVAVVGIPKTIDNDIPVIDKSFGFDTAVEEAQRAINAAHVEAESMENGFGLVKLMGRYCGFIAMYATLASRDVDCCLIPESPFILEGPGGLYEYIAKRLKDNGHMVLVIAEGAGQELLSGSLSSSDKQDASGNKLLQDVGLWLSQRIKDHFSKELKMTINLKYIDPTYMIRAIPSNASDNVYCTLLAQSAVHGAMAGYTGYTSGLVNGRQTYIPFYRITEKQNEVVITDRMWARLLSSTNQPSFLTAKDIVEDKKEEEQITQLYSNSVDEEEFDSDSRRFRVNDVKEMSFSFPLNSFRLIFIPVPHHSHSCFSLSLLCVGSLIFVKEKTTQKMGIRFILMVNKQGQTRLAQYYEYLTLEERRALEGEIVRKCLARNDQQCSFVEHRNYKIIYRRYASLFFLVGVDNDENELAILEFIHLLVETMDRHFGNVCELDIMFHLEKAHFMLEEMVMNGCIVETSKSNILSPIQLMEKSS